MNLIHGRVTNSLYYNALDSILPRGVAQIEAYAPSEWEKITQPVDSGGLRILHLPHINLAFMAKLG